MTDVHDDLDEPVFNIPDGDDVTPWTKRDACSGLISFGGIGSGKTTGSGYLIGERFLRLNMGGCILTAKADEKAMWIELCKKTGRMDDLIIIEPGQPNYFNVLAYEAEAKGDQQSFTQNIVQLLKTVIRSGEEKSSGKSDDPFWEKALDMVLYHIIELSQLAYGKVTIPLLHSIAQSLPKAGEDQGAAPTGDKGKRKLTAYDKAYMAAQENMNRLLDDLRTSENLQGVPMNQFIEIAEEKIPEIRRMSQVDNFFFEVFISLSSKTRSIIDFTLIGFLFNMIQDPVYSLFAKHPSTFRPEDCYTQGKIILINLPVKLYHNVGRDAQVLFKVVYQRAMERRNIAENGRVVFLWSDESQLFLHELDAEFQATARSSRVAVVMLSQNLPNLQASMSGSKTEHRVKSLLGTLATKVFHANVDVDTNKYASELMGEAYEREESESISTSEGKTTVTKTISAKLVRMVRPEQITMLTSGGPMNHFNVTGYIHVQGKEFSNGLNFKKILFKQNVKL